VAWQEDYRDWRLGFGTKIATRDAFKFPNGNPPSRPLAPGAGVGEGVKSPMRCSSTGSPVAALPISAFLGLFTALTPPAPAQVLWDADFSARPAGAYGLEAAKADFGPFVLFARVPAGNARMAKDPELGRMVLEARYPKGCVGPDACALQVRSGFPSRNEAWMRYRVKFGAGFDWKKGGKLPGLCGGKCNTGCVDVSGSDGWSARLMWHGDGKLVQYVYHPDGTTGCGTDFAYASGALAKGRWYEVINQVILNTPGTGGGSGRRDGVLRAWLDGRLVLERTDLRFRDAAAVGLDQFYFSTFHGGDSPDWGPGTDSYASFSDLAVTAGDPRLSSALGPPRRRASRVKPGPEPAIPPVDGRILPGRTRKPR
jgi:hypothetical protein